ncbi:MAG: DNA polymerase IV [Candidatus Eremiobacteraeota bacterium]|nr:DNA polymerase IV [Candidatus Eremiobacteraeota bacterium]
MIAHFDIDAFYASVEIRDNPELRGKPVAVAGRSRRAVVLTASYEARPFGVKSAVPLYKALEACPQLIVVRPDMMKYKNVSREIFAIFGARGHGVEGLSMDEAFVDFGDIALDEAVQLAQAIRREILETTRLTVSAGVANGKMVAKILSDTCKPNGCASVPPGEEAAFLAPLPVGRLWGIGPKTQARLSSRGITTIGEIASLDDARLYEIFGNFGREVHELALGIDRRTVDTSSETKSISTEETFEYDVTDERELAERLKQQARELSESLERHNLSAQTIGIKIKKSDFTVVGRQTHLAEPTRDVRRIYRAALFCLQRAALNGTPVRLLGTRVAALFEGEPLQQSLFAQQSSLDVIGAPKSIG